MSDSLGDFDYSGGIFGDALGDDPLSPDAGTQPPAATSAMTVATTQQAAAAQPTVPPLAPPVDAQTDAAFFVRDQTGMSYLRPDMAAVANGIIEQLYAAAVPAASNPGGLPPAFHAYTIAPAAAVAAIPAYQPLHKVLEAERAGGNTFVLLPKQILSPTAPTGPVMMVVVSDAFGAPVAMQSNDVFRHLPAAAPQKKQGVSLAMTALIGAGVLAGGYAITRLVQKKPLLPGSK